MGTLLCPSHRALKDMDILEDVTRSTKNIPEQNTPAWLRGCPEDSFPTPRAHPRGPSRYHTVKAKPLKKGLNLRQSGGGKGAGTVLVDGAGIPTNQLLGLRSHHNHSQRPEGSKLQHPPPIRFPLQLLQDLHI